MVVLLLVILGYLLGCLHLRVGCLYVALLNDVLLSLDLDVLDLLLWSDYLLFLWLVVCLILSAPLGFTWFYTGCLL